MFIFDEKFIRHAEDDGAGNGGLPDDVLDGLRNLIDRKDGNESEVAKMLYQDNYKLRGQIRDLKQRIPADGTVSLPAEDAQALEAYKALGVPDALKTAVEERDNLSNELTGLRRDATLRDAAEASGYELDVLRTLAGDASIEIKEETQGDKTVPVAYLNIDDKTQPLTKYAQEKWAKFMPALAPSQGESQTPKTGTTFVKQGVSTNGKPKSFVDQFIADRNKAANKE